MSHAQRRAVRSCILGEVCLLKEAAELLVIADLVKFSARDRQHELVAGRAVDFTSCGRSGASRDAHPVQHDLSQVELRIAARVANEEVMIEAYRTGRDLHRLTASQVLGKPEATLLAHHQLDGEAHPLGWAHRSGAAPVVYLALGHDGRAYDADSTRELVARSAAWLLRAGAGKI